MLKKRKTDKKKDHKSSLLIMISRRPTNLYVHQWCFRMIILCTDYRNSLTVIHARRLSHSQLSERAVTRLNEWLARNRTHMEQLFYSDSRLISPPYHGTWSTTLRVMPMPLTKIALDRVAIFLRIIVHTHSVQAFRKQKTRCRKALTTFFYFVSWPDW